MVVVEALLEALYSPKIEKKTLGIHLLYHHVSL